jgi:hypothetical protein
MVFHELSEQRQFDLAAPARHAPEMQRRYREAARRYGRRVRLQSQLRCQRIVATRFARSLHNNGLKKAA